ncbi:hypothetical protein [Streptomyces griseofuscus]|uniref:hypothetical protein n=1 Tax=Streptomyces griseofuscus TaxID=146922 RepID=UPI003823C045
MTDLSTEAVAVEAAPAPPSPPPESQTAADKDGKEVEHTPGGWPVVPLALTGANSTVGAVAAAGLAGGPVAALVAATGAVVLGTVAAARNRKPDPRREARRAAARAAGHQAARTSSLRRNGTGTGAGVGRGSRPAGSGASRTGGRSGSGLGQHRRGHGNGPAAHRSGAVDLSKRGASGRGALKRAPGGAAGKSAAGRVGQIKALRAAQHTGAGTRADQRAQTTGARRAVADARRDAKAAGGYGRLGKGGIPGGRLGGVGRKARAARDAAVDKHRARRDARTGDTVAAQRARLRKAPARRAARAALRRSAARFHGRRLLAALLSLPVGLLGCLTTPLGRKFGIPALMHPGRRLYRRLAATAGEQRTARDEAIREELAEQEAAADAEAMKDGTDGIADGVERPAPTTPSTTPEVSEGADMPIGSGFRFEDHAIDMQAAAMTYEPDGCMEILRMVEDLPSALSIFANVMAVLAERSDNEFPLEKEVAEGFNAIYGALMSAVAVAEDMGPAFRKAHAADIARHEDPRNGAEAEKGWNV